MASEMKSAKSRRYRKRRRAELEAQTRERITEAAVKLHGTVGPARTTVSAIAADAGVQRATVYRHFRSEEELFEACSAHYWARHPRPDPRQWAELSDPAARLRQGLAEMYRFYGETEPMLERTSRDGPLVPAMGTARERFLVYLESLRAALIKGRSERGQARARVAAAVGHALAFSTWRSLTREQGLDDSEAVALMVRLVGSAGRRASAL
jgi:AcrR family transcriptional regulator